MYSPLSKISEASLLPKEPRSLTKIRKSITESTSQLYEVIVSDITTAKLPLRKLQENVLIRYVFAWVLWLLLGTVVYANINFDGNYAKGFYFSVNIGYSIGWGVFHDRSTRCKVFSILYILMGATFLTRWIAYLIERAVTDTSSIYEKSIIRKNIRKTSRLKGFLLDAYVYIVVNHSKLFMIYLWFVCIFFGTSWSCVVIHWSLIDGLYFSISSMSTAGAWGIPHDSPDYVFAVTGLFAAFSIPIMGIAVGDIASLILESRYIEPVFTSNNVLKISDKEFRLLNIVRSGESKSSVDRTEYILLQLLRDDRIDLREVQMLSEEFSSTQENQRLETKFAQDSSKGAS